MEKRHFRHFVKKIGPILKKKIEKHETLAIKALTCLGFSFLDLKGPQISSKIGIERFSFKKNLSTRNVGSQPFCIKYLSFV